MSKIALKIPWDPPKKNMKILMENLKIRKQDTLLASADSLGRVVLWRRHWMVAFLCFCVNKVVPQFGIAQLVNISPITMAYGRYIYTFLSLRFFANQLITGGAQRCSYMWVSQNGDSPKSSILDWGFPWNKPCSYCGTPFFENLHALY